MIEENISLYRFWTKKGYNSCPNYWFPELPGLYFLAFFNSKFSAFYALDLYRLKQLKELFIFIILFNNVFSGCKNPAEVDNITSFSYEVESVLRDIADLLIANNSNSLIKYLQV
jgi:hypothetical protein